MAVLNSSAGKLDFTLQQGSNDPIVLTVYDDASTLKDLTNYEARMQVREYVDSSTVLLSLTSSPAAGLTISVPNSTVTIDITAVQSAAITAPCMVYDLELIESADEDTVERLIGGSITLSKEVTR